MSFFRMFLGALLLSTSVQASNYKASCQPDGDGLLCRVSVYSCDDVDFELASQVCMDKGFSKGFLDPYGELIGEDNDSCASEGFGGYTIVGCSN